MHRQRGPLRGWTMAFAVVAPSLVLTLTGACRAPTEVTLDVSYGGACGDLKDVAILVGAEPQDLEERRIPSGVYTSLTTECTGGGAVGTLVVTPNGGSSRGAVVVLAGLDRPAERCTKSDGYFGCIVARRTFTFVEHTELALPIVLDPDCKNVPCDAVSTCKKGSCVSSEAACSGSQCDQFGVGADGGPALVDAPTSSDAVAHPTSPRPPPPPPPPPTDGAPDAPPDAVNDGPGGGCGIHVVDGVPCPTKAGTRCAPGQSCCPNGSGGFDAGLCGACAAPPQIQCRSERNCQNGDVCCAPNEYQATMCQPACMTPGDAGPTWVQVCEQDCECPPGKRCTGGNPPSLISYGQGLSTCQ